MTGLLPKLSGVALFISVICYQGILPAIAQQNHLDFAFGKQKMVPLGDANGLENIKKAGFYEGRYYWMARFAKNQSPAISIKQSSIDLIIHEALGQNYYQVSSSFIPDLAILQKQGIFETGVIEPTHKYSDWLKIQGPSSDGHVLVSFLPQIPLADLKKWLEKEQFKVLGSLLPGSRVFEVQLPRNSLTALAALPFVTFIQPMRKDEVLNEKTRFFNGAFIANAPIVNGGYGLQGEGVTIGVGDLGEPSVHPDLAGRITNHAGGVVQNHGAHTTGIIAGAGLLQSERKGFAPKAEVINQFFGNIWLNAEAYTTKRNMVLTNNSYGSTQGDCYYYGIYDLHSHTLDQQAALYPSLLHVFAAGNSGEHICAPLPQYFGNVLGGYQTAKNVITVGRVDHNQLVTSTSSGGPVKDGRLKPEIMSLGVVESTNSSNGYYVDFGTSLSAPGVTGGLALMYQYYRQLNGGANPKSNLMKAVTLAGARDIGPKGPDYRHGYGLMDLESSLRIIKAKTYLLDQLLNGANRDTAITIPAGLARFKALLYWHDPAANPLVSKALVNNLDIEVIGPNGTVLPKKLNPALPLALATEGKDAINNSELVEIDAPTGGNYTIRVKGFDISQVEPQAFSVAFDYVPAGLKIRTPVKGDTWSRSAPDEFEVVGVAISWDDEGTLSGGTYLLEYSLNGGTDWGPIVDNLNENLRYYGWRPPVGTATDNALVRITKSNTPQPAVSGVFSILEKPGSIGVAKPCPGYLTLTWAAVTGATDYEVIMKKGTEMVPVGLVTPPSALAYTINGLSKDSTYYVSVRARINGQAGRWLRATAQIPNGTACTNAVSNGDLVLDSITNPKTGRNFTLGALGVNETLKVRIKNNDNVIVPATDFTVSYSLDGAAFTTPVNGTGSIPSVGTYLHEFTGLNLSSPGVHTLVAVVKKTAGTPDLVAVNDTFKIIIKNLTNPLLDLTTALQEDFEAATNYVELNGPQMGILGTDAWDYWNTYLFSRLRSGLEQIEPFNGNRAVSLDHSRQFGTGINPVNYLLGTFNLNNYNSSHEVRLDFMFKKHGSYQQPHPQNKVWARGAESESWVEVYDLGLNQPAQSGVWKRSKSIELNDIFLSALPVQGFSTSAQVRLGQYAPLGMADETRLAGYSFDNIRLYIATNDMQVISINEPAIYSCGLNNSVPIIITIRNSMAAPATNVVVRYRINGGALISETVPVAIAGNQQLAYQFTTEANFSITGPYQIEAMVFLAGDNVPENDAIVANIQNQPIISQFPYLESFENDAGSFFAEGFNSSWQWGVPSSLLIKQAAHGQKAWKTSLSSNYNDAEVSTLNTPCFNLTNLQNPTLSFSMAYDIEDCMPETICDALWMEYSTDGFNWQKLGAAGQGLNWYDEPINNIWVKRRQSHWHAATISLPKAPNLRLRFVMFSDDATAYEGVAIDNFHIYDLDMPMFSGTNNSNSVAQPVAGSQPVHFTEGGKLMATLFPNGNNVGNIAIQTFMHNGTARWLNNQYYGNRNFTIKPAENPWQTTTPLGVRLYFTDREVDSLRLAKDCPNCSVPPDYTYLGITKYTDADKTVEDGSISNNQFGFYTFFGDEARRLVPYDSGYYVDIEVESLSEFWLSDGESSNIPLPGNWLNFKATKINAHLAKLAWSAIDEADVKNYEVQVAAGTQALRESKFETIGYVDAKNNAQSQYQYIDSTANKSGNYFYRIKQITHSGVIFYSPVRSLRFERGLQGLKVYPNPASQRVILQLPALVSKQMVIQVTNSIGQKVWSTTIKGPLSDGLNYALPLKGSIYKPGVYLVEVLDGEMRYQTKFIKN